MTATQALRIALAKEAEKVGFGEIDNRGFRLVITYRYGRFTVTKVSLICREFWLDPLGILKFGLVVGLVLDNRRNASEICDRTAQFTCQVSAENGAVFSCNPKAFRLLHNSEYRGCIWSSPLSAHHCAATELNGYESSRSRTRPFEDSKQPYAGGASWLSPACGEVGIL